MNKREISQISVVATDVKWLRENAVKVDRHFEKLNGAVVDALIKLAKTDEIAKSAQSKSDSNRKYLDRITIAIIVAVITTIGAVVGVGFMAGVF